MKEEEFELTFPEGDVVAEPRKILGYVVPEGALRIKVTDDKGKVCWRKLDEVLPTDAPSLAPSGMPVFMTRPIGRPPKTDLHQALAPVSDLVGDLIKIKAGQMRSDPIIQVAEDSPESGEVLNQVMLSIAEEAASLRFERMEAERNGRDASAYSVRRVQALKAIGDTWIKRREQISQQAVDMESAAFQELFKFIVETFTRALHAAGIRAEQCDNVIGTFARMLDDSWKNEARNRMKD